MLLLALCTGANPAGLIDDANQAGCVLGLNGEDRVFYGARSGTGQANYSVPRNGASRAALHFERVSATVQTMTLRLDDGRALPTFMGQALRGEPITVFGDGSQTRSFCYVDDLVDGIYRLLLSDEVMPVNIGNPDEITIKEFAEEVVALTGSRSTVAYEPLPADDPKVRQPDITKARTLLGWEPKVGRSEGLKRTLAYFQQQIAEEVGG